MSDRTAAAAINTMLATNLPLDDLGLELYGLMEAIGFDYERWCRIVEMNPDDPDTEAIYDRTRYDYLEAWTIVGEENFRKLINPVTDKWARIAGSA